MGITPNWQVSSNWFKVEIADLMDLKTYSDFVLHDSFNHYV